MNRQTDRQIDRQTDRQTDRQADEWMDGWMDGYQNDLFINNDSWTNQRINRRMISCLISFPQSTLKSNSAVNIQSILRLDSYLFLPHGGSSRQRTLITARDGS